METITCAHNETTIPDGNGLLIAQCSRCGQTRRFKPSDRFNDTITKLGRIGDKIVMPAEGQKLEITPEESRLVREGWDSLSTGKRSSPYHSPKTQPSKEIVAEVRDRYSRTEASREAEAADRDAKASQEAESTPEPVKTYSCKKCDFTTPDKYKLIGHYGSKHSWRHEAEHKKKEEIMETPEQPAPSGLPAVPAKPDVSGMNMRQRNGVMHDYYEANKEAILLYFDRIGEKPMMKHWGIVAAVWRVMRARWLPDRFQYPPWYKRAKPATTKPEPAVVKKETAAPPPPPPGPQEYIEKGFPPFDPADRWWKRLCNRLFGSREDRPKDKRPELPTFPDFDSAWTEAVQLRWFDTYKELAGK